MSFVGRELHLPHPVVQSVYRASVVGSHSCVVAVYLRRSKTGWTVAEVWGMWWLTDELLREFLDPLSIESQLELCDLYLL